MIRKIVILFILLIFSLTINAEEFKHHDVTFYLDEEMKTKNKELVNLILLTESMDDEERQYWFDIMPSMTKPQIERLFNILDTERKKLADLEVKYQEEIKALNDKHLIEWKESTQKKAEVSINKSIDKNKENVKSLYYISFNKNEIPRIKISPVNDSKITNPYVPDDDDNLSRYEHMVLVEFGKKLISDVDKYKDLYDQEVFNGYINKIIDSAISLNDTNTLSAIYNGKLADKDTILQNMYIAKNDFNSLALQYEKNLNSTDWNKNIFTKLLDLTKWRYKKNCADKCKDVLISYLDKIEKEDYPFKIKEIDNYFRVELILLDMISYLNKDIISNKLKKKINEFIALNSEKEKAFYQENKDWYIKLNDSYFNDSIDGLYQQKLSDYLNTADFNSIEGSLLEASAYFAFYLIKNNKEDEALQILLASKNLGESMYSTAYGYIEKDLVNFLVDVSSEPHKFKKGHITLGMYQESGNQKEFKPFGKKYAIVIGVSDYENLSNPSKQKDNKLYDLKYADQDALDFEKFLQKTESSSGGWEIATFINSDAKTVDVRKKIDNILSIAKDNDLVYIFFSGHARLNPNNQEEVYLLTQEFNPDDPYSGIPYEWLISTINRSKAKHLITFIDACRSGTIKNSKGSSLVDQNLLNDVLKHSPTKVIFTSGSGSQISYEDDSFKNGIFTHFLLKGLYGESKDVNQDGFVNLNELEDYTSNNVSTYTSTSKDATYQRPRVSNLDPTFSVQFPLSIR